MRLGLKSQGSCQNAAKSMHAHVIGWNTTLELSQGEMTYGIRPSAVRDDNSHLTAPCAIALSLSAPGGKKRPTFERAAVSTIPQEPVVAVLIVYTSVLSFDLSIAWAKERIKFKPSQTSSKGHW